MVSSGIVFASLVLYLLFVILLSNAVDNKTTRHKSFWWVFFFGLVGAIIAILLDIRDK